MQRGHGTLKRLQVQTERDKRGDSLPCTAVWLEDVLRGVVIDGGRPLKRPPQRGSLWWVVVIESRFVMFVCGADPEQRKRKSPLESVAAETGSSSECSIPRARVPRVSGRPLTCPGDTYWPGTGAEVSTRTGGALLTRRGAFSAR